MLGIEGHDRRKVPEHAPIVQPVADHEAFLEHEPRVLYRHREDPSIRPVKKRADPDLRRAVGFQVPAQEVQSEPRVDHPFA